MEDPEPLSDDAGPLPMEAGELLRHRVRVVAFAMIAGLCAALLNGWTAYRDTSGLWFTLAGRIHYYGWAGMEDEMTSGRDEFCYANFIHRTPAVSLVSFLFLTIGGTIFELRMRRDHPGNRFIHCACWIALWISVVLLSTYTFWLLRNPLLHDHPMQQSVISVLYSNVLTGGKYGLLWLIPVALFRYLDRSDWVPRLQQWIGTSFAILAAIWGSNYFSAAVASQQPLQVLERAYSGMRLSSYRPWDEAKWQAGLPAATARFEESLRQRNTSRAVPAARITSAVILFVAGTLIGVPRRFLSGITVLQVVAWGCAWVLAGAAGFYAAEYWRGIHGAFFAPLGTTSHDRLDAATYRGAVLGLWAALYCLIPLLSFSPLIRTTIWASIRFFMLMLPPSPPRRFQPVYSTDNPPPPLLTGDALEL